ncbi:MAG: hypothetical protein WCV83_02540 [Candidatus Magasanikbacteria bacterium]|jgi:hypothetical protein
MKISTLIVLVAVVLSGVSASASALTPVFNIREGYVVLLKDGLTPASASTRYDISLSEKVSNKVSIAGGIGLATPNDSCKPSPRLSAGVSLGLTDRWSTQASVLYQRNVGYGGKPSSDLVGLGTGLAYGIGNGLSLSMAFGLAKTLDGGDYSLLFQPSLGIAFL